MADKTPSEVLEEWRAGALSRSEMPVEIFQALTEQNLAEFLASAPAEIRALLDERAGSAPRTDAAWEKMYFAMGGTVRAQDEKAVQGLEKELDRRKARFRRGVELYRRHTAS